MTKRTVWYDEYRKIPKSPRRYPTFSQIVVGTISCITVLTVSSAISVVVRALIPLQVCDPPGYQNKSPY